MTTRKSRATKRPLLPKPAFWIVILSGWGSILFALWALGSNFQKYADDVSSYTNEPAPHYYHWYTIVASLAVGIAAVWIAVVGKHYWYDTVVGTGHVVGHSWSSSRSGDRYYLRIEGQNRIGQTIVEDVSVQPRTYNSINVGTRWNCGE